MFSYSVIFDLFGFTLLSVCGVHLQSKYVSSKVYSITDNGLDKRELHRSVTVIYWWLICSLISWFQAILRIGAKWQLRSISRHNLLSFHFCIIWRLSDFVFLEYFCCTCKYVTCWIWNIRDQNRKRVTTELLNWCLLQTKILLSKSKLPTVIEKNNKAIAEIV